MANVIEALRYMIGASWEGESDVKRASGSIRGLGDETARVEQKSKAAWAGMGKAVAGFGIAAAGAAVVGKQLYQALGEGADLLRAEDQFGRLAESIDATADSMLGRLRDATAGMVTDASLVQSATQIMSLGLQDTEDGVVRLTSVAGKLGWDMSQVILTMANDSIMRLDALGLSIESVNEKQQRLMSEGFTKGQAFDLAVIEAGEEKYRLLGDSVETTAGQMAIMETAVTNAQDEFKISLVEGFADGLKDIASNASDAGKALTDAAGGAGLFLGTLAGGTLGPLGNELRLSGIVDFGVDQGQISRLEAFWAKLGGIANQVELNPEFAQKMEELIGQMEAFAAIRSQFIEGQGGRNAHYMIVDEDETEVIRLAAERTTELSNAAARAHAAGTNYAASLELQGIHIANVAAVTESAAWNTEHFGGTLRAAWEEADLAAVSFGNLYLELDKLSGETFDVNVSYGRDIGYENLRSNTANTNARDNYYGSGGTGGNDMPDVPGARPAARPPGGQMPQVNIYNNNELTAALTMTMLQQMTRNRL